MFALETGKNVLEDIPLHVVEDNDSGVYSMEEARESGLIQESKSKSESVKLMSDGVRSEMFRLIQEIESLHEAHLKNLRGIYQNSMPIDKNTQSRYLNLVNEVRERWSRDIDEIERLFKDVVENKLVEREI